jgi:hypothetical protein
MRSVFRQWDVEAGSKGYVTEEDFKKRVSKTVERFPELSASIEKLHNQAHRHWVDHCNVGVEMPEGYRLTGAQYIQNMWLFVHNKPAFEKYIREASKTFWDGVDKEKKGYLTKEEAGEIGFRVTNDKEHRGIFEALDEGNTGRIVLEDSIKAQLFFFTDQEDEEHPFNFVRGPLVED